MAPGGVSHSHCMCASSLPLMLHCELQALHACTCSTWLMHAGSAVWTPLSWQLHRLLALEMVDHVLQHEICKACWLPLIAESMHSVITCADTV